MIEQLNLGGRFSLPGTTITLNRMGYGTMQLAGPEVWGPPRDVNAAISVLREAVDAGVNHLDTSDYYGPHVTNQIIKRALSPYPSGLVIVTKVGARFVRSIASRYADATGVRLASTAVAEHSADSRNIFR
jgi:pyridoxine 4-dehydrogenase